jgi:hypothetical protein
MNIVGMVDRFMRSQNNTATQVRQTDNLSLAVAQTEPPYKEVARAGRHMVGAISTLTGRAPVQSIPTTTATVYLYNNDPVLSYVVDFLNVTCVSGTPAAGLAVLGLLTKPTGTPPTAGANYGIANCNPASSRQSKAIVAESYTIPAVDTTGRNSWPAWMALTSQQQAPGAAYVGGGDASAAFLEGRIVIPPGWGLATAFLSGSGTSPLYGLTFMWTELEIDNEP